MPTGIHFAHGTYIHLMLVKKSKNLAVFDVSVTHGKTANVLNNHP
jgi:hypothetical protein